VQRAETQMRDSKMAKRAIAFAGLLTAMLIAAGLAVPQIAGATPNPPGNNGTVKIHEVPLDSDPHNQPHVGCVFTVSFFGFDEGDVATVVFRAWPPTGKGQVLLRDTPVDIGADDNSGGGSSAGFDGEKTYTLDFGSIEPQPQQGFHVKLRVIVTSPGSKTPKFNKYKVFWVQPCEEQGTTTTTTTKKGGGTTTTTTKKGGGTSSSVGGAETTGLPTSSGGFGASTTPSRARLPRTGSNALPIVVTGLLLLAVGAGGVLASRRLRTR
jgi:LPXTG-motif cell wall-anchored protein